MLAGVLIKTWNLKVHTESPIRYRGIAVYRKQIFMVNLLRSTLQVVSVKSGNLLYEWRTVETNLKSTTGISVTKNNVYLINSENNRIHVFTHEGEFRFSILLPETSFCRRLDQVFAFDEHNQVYVSDRMAQLIHILKINF